MKRKFLGSLIMIISLFFSCAMFNEVMAAKPEKLKKVYSEEQLKKIYEKAEQYYDMKFFEKAIKNYSIVIDQKPNSTNCLYSRGLAYLEKNRADEALADFLRIEELRRDSWIGYYASGRADYGCVQRHNCDGGNW